MVVPMAKEHAALSCTCTCAYAALRCDLVHGQMQRRGKNSRYIMKIYHGEQANNRNSEKDYIIQFQFEFEFQSRKDPKFNIL